MLLYEFYRQFPELDENDNYSYCYIVASKAGRFIRRGKWDDDNIMDARSAYKYRRLYSFTIDFLDDVITITVGGRGMMEESISRQAAIDSILTWDKFGCDERGMLVPWREGLVPYVRLKDVIYAIANLPFAQPVEAVPERKKGRWVELYDSNYKCSECGAWWHSDDMDINEEFQFCPSCGARMEGAENETMDKRHRL